MQIDVINNRTDLDGLEGRWASVASTLGLQTPYTTYDWYRTALETTDKKKDPFLLFFRSDNKDIALAPLVHSTIKRYGLNINAFSFVDNPHTPFSDFLTSTDDYIKVLIHLLGYLREKFGGFFYIDLNEIRLDNGRSKVDTHPALQKLAITHREDKTGSRYLTLGKPFQEMVGSLKAHTQKEFKRKLKRISDLGTVELVRLDQNKHLQIYLTNFFELFAKVWERNESHPEFYIEMCQRFASRGNLYFWALQVDGKPIAYLICIHEGETMYGIKTTYDPSYAAFSPGVVLFYKCIEQMAAMNDVREFDIGRGNEQFKREWTADSHEHARLLIYPRTVIWSLAHKVKQRLQKS